MSPRYPQHFGYHLKAVASGIARTRTLAPGFDPATCDLCGSGRSKVLLSIEGRSFTSDSRIVDLPLKKLVCRDCGLARNGIALSPEFLEAHYTFEYSLGIQAAQAEPVFFTAQGHVPRSRMVFEWIESGLRKAGIELASLHDVLEIGCGEGSLLRRVAAACPNHAVRGLEMNSASVGIARAAGLDVEQGAYSDVSGEHDLIYSFAVIEHVPSPSHYIALLKSHLKPDGCLLVAQPCQDHGSTDIFFCDHLHHFTSAHVEAYARKHGLNEAYAANNHPHIRNFSLHVLSERGPSGPRSDIVGSDGDGYPDVDRWLSLFRSIDAWLDAHREKKLVVWGIGQTFMLLCAYTRLDPANITAAIEENLERFHGVSLSFPVMTSAEIRRRLGTDSAVLFTFEARSEHTRILQENGIAYFSFSP